MDWTAFFLSLRLALLTTLLLALLGLPLAYWLSFSAGRWRPLLEAVVALPLVLPPTVLGFYVLLAVAPEAPLGRLYRACFGESLAFSFEGLLLASLLYSLPFAVQPMVRAFRSVPFSLLEISWSLGSSRWSTFFRILLPLAWPGVLCGLILSFAHTLGEFGVVLMVGGNIPGRTRTLSISIYDHVQALDYGAAGQTSLFLLLFSFAVLTLAYHLQKERGLAWPARSD